MLRTAAVLLALFAASPQQKPAEPPTSAFPTIPCDAEGILTCSLDQVETVTSPRSLEDMRIIGKYMQLISERNRRYYMSWQTKAPSAAFEFVRRVKSFPYLPYDDTYSIVGLDVVLSQQHDLLTVRYPKKPKEKPATPVPASGYAEYSTQLSTFINSLEKEIVKLKKYEK